jgi:hypothetical protein
VDDRLAGRPGNGGEVNLTAAEQRQRVAHGETLGINVQIKKAPDGAKEISVGEVRRGILREREAFFSSLPPTRE